MASREQLMAVALSCREYDPQYSFTSSVNYEGASCERCSHWDGEKCVIHVFDKVLTGLDQT